MTTQQILALETTKTEKIKKLFELGLTRREVSDIMSVGYGFVQNVYARTYPDRIRRRNSNLTNSASRTSDLRQNVV
jgi:predicted DNA-binding transcriptional regulator